MKVTITKLQNENIVKGDGIHPLETGKVYDINVVGDYLSYYDRYELMYSDGTRPHGVTYPCGNAEDDNGNKYVIFVERRSEYSLFGYVNKWEY